MLKILVLLTLACIPKKKYDALEEELRATQEQLAQRTTERDAQAARALSIEEALAAEQKEVEQLNARIKALEAELAAAQGSLDAANKEKASLLKDRSSLQASVADMQAALKELAERRAAAEERVAQFKDLLSRFKKLIDAGQLRVKIVDGRMVVVLATDILFASGKADLSESGRVALLEVAKILATIPDRHYQVEGHTDNVPIQTERFPSNWELASARALTVVRTLEEGGVSSARLSGASYGEYRPVADNKTLDGRVSNRRIEIVVVPDLSELPGFEELKQAAGE
jgi:chemotaxis protein MotB